MIVVFVQWGPPIAQAELMVRSCKKFGYEVWQLNDERATVVPGVDKVIVKPRTTRPMVYRTQRLAELDFPYVSMDTDIIVKRDISVAQDQKYDAILTWRPNKEAERTSWNGGLLFINNQAFMQAVHERVKTMSDDLQDWNGDQVALFETVHSGKFKVKSLTHHKWNFTPAYPRDKRGEVYVYHFKGNRKGWMHHHL